MEVSVRFSAAECEPQEMSSEQCTKRCTVRLSARCGAQSARRPVVLADWTLVAGPPVEVGVTMYVLSISSVSEVLMVLARGCLR